MIVHLFVSIFGNLRGTKPGYLVVYFLQLSIRFQE